MFCLTPSCPKPTNPDGAKFCQACGLRLRLGDRYSAYQPLGGGNASRTFLGIDGHQLVDGRCIIKRFVNDQDEERFRQEAARLDEVSRHPQIPDLYAYFERDRAQYLVQEFVEGGNLLQELTQTGSFDAAQIRAVLLEILPLLQFLHDHQIVHRDIKPTNLIRAVGREALPSSPSTSLMLVDFGAAKRLTESALAKPGTLMGSAEYAAPEQLMGQATFASDLYSLGVTCIHLLTGLSPFELFDGAAGVWRWRVVAGAVDNHLAQILDRLLAMNLSDRYPSAAAVLQDLGVTIKSELQPALRPSVLRSGLVAKAAETQQWNCVATVETGLEVAAIALSADGKTVAIASPDGIVRLVALADGSIQRQSERQPGMATAAAISPNGETLVTGSSDRTIQVWQCQDGKILQTLSGHTDTVTTFAFSPDGTRLYSGSRDRTIRVWDLGTGQTMTTLTGHKGAVVALALDGDRQLLASGDVAGAVKIWHVGTRELLRTLSGHAAAVSAVALMPDHQTVISGSWDMSLKLRHVHAGGLRHSLVGHLLPITAIALHPNGETLATASHDATVKLWNLPHGKLLSTLSGHTAAVEAVAFLADGQVVSGDRAGTIQVWQQG